MNMYFGIWKHWKKKINEDGNLLKQFESVQYFLSNLLDLHKAL